MTEVDSPEICSGSSRNRRRGGHHMGSSQAAVTWLLFASSVKAEEGFAQKFV